MFDFNSSNKIEEKRNSKPCDLCAHREVCSFRNEYVVLEEGIKGYLERSETKIFTFRLDCPFYASGYSTRRN